MIRQTVSITLNL